MPPGHPKKLLRSIQVLFPWLAGAKAEAEYRFYSITGRLFEPEYRGLGCFDWDGQLLLDVGANRGQSILAFRNAVPRCRIVAFEPNPRLAAALVERYRGDAEIRIEQCALAAASGSLRLYIPSYNGFPFDGLASLSRSEAEEWLNAERLYGFDRRHVAVQEVDVPTRRLDSFRLAPALVKLNVQRAEIEVLKGAAETLTRHRPVILSAYPWGALIQMLARFGYRPYAYRRGIFQAGMLGRRFTWFLLSEHAERVRSAASPCLSLSDKPVTRPGAP